MASEARKAVHFHKIVVEPFFRVFIANRFNFFHILKETNLENIHNLKF